MKIFKKLPLALLCLLLSSCATPKTAVHDTALFEATPFAALPGWQNDKTAEALTAFQKSCDSRAKKQADDAVGPQGIGGTAADWQDVCAKLPPAGASDADARAYFENNFTAYKIRSEEGGKGLFTGYYAPIMLGSDTQTSPAAVPLYARPDDLVTVNLGEFMPELKGKTVMGRVKGENLVPYYTRAEIGNGAIKDAAKQIVWVNDPVDAFFLHIQGSGQVKLPDGTVMNVGYAAQNGQPYSAVGKELVKRGDLPSDAVSMQTIRAYLESHPQDATDVMNTDKSFVFFRKLDGDGPIGAEGVALTSGRSLAVDPKFLPYGAPVFLDAESPDKTGRLQKLMVAQDTGGAINGVIRGDYFWGAGDDAVKNAGIMKSAGQDYILLPKAVKIPSTHKPSSSFF